MADRFRVVVFGKAGCDKCRALNKRLDTVLGKPEWQDFEKLYCDLETEGGLVEFCNAECINPQRVPAFLVARRIDGTGDYERLPALSPGSYDEVCKNSRLYMWRGLQTDYSEVGRGLITPQMLQTVLAEARQP